MAQKVLNEEQMREYIENEVKAALLAEGIDENMDEGLLSGLAGILPLIKKVGGIKNLSMESIMGVLLGQIAIAPILTKLLTSLGIPADGALGKFIIQTAVSAGGAYLGDWIDKKWDPVGLDGGNGNFNLGGLLGLGGSTSATGGDGFEGGGTGGGVR